jgi:branched-chain amino acid aminotransferase
MSFENSNWVWKNGEFVQWEDATFHISSHGLHYGSGVFEGIRAYETKLGPAVFRLSDHLDRLFYSAGQYGLEIPYTRDELAYAIYSLIKLNELKSCYIRPICFFGSSSLGLNPAKCPTEVAILAWRWGSYLGSAGLSEGVRITISPWRKFHSSMMPTTAKACGQYINSILAVKEALGRGFDEALLLNIEGRLAEGSGENLFIIKNGVIFTNRADDSILVGITRDSVIQIAQKLGIKVITRSLTLDDIFTADEAFLTGTAAEITPIREIDGEIIGSGKKGKVTHEIQTAFFKIVSAQDEQFACWLHFVEQHRAAHSDTDAAKPLSQQSIQSCRAAIE